MEFCDGGDLWERIALARREKTELQAPTALGWLLQVVGALRYLHAIDILHRDIKLENIFITQDETVAKIGDFGLAKVIEEDTTKTQCGTPDYMAPEVLEGKTYSAKVGAAQQSRAQHSIAEQGTA